MQKIEIVKEKPLFSISSLAEFLNVHYKTVCQWREQGRLPSPDLILYGGSGKKKMPRWKYETIISVIESGVI